MLQNRPGVKVLFQLAILLLLEITVCGLKRVEGKSIADLRDDLKASLPDSMLATTLEELAWAYKDIDIDSMQYFGEKALRVAYRTGQKQVLAYALAEVSHAHKVKAEYDSAEFYLLRSIEVRKASGNQKDLGSAENLLGYLKLRMGELPEALSAFQRGLGYVKGKGWDGIEAGSWDGMGQVFLAMGNHEESLKAYQKSLEINQTRGDSIAQAKSLQSIGNYFQSTGRAIPALESYKKSERIYRAKGLQLSIAQILMNQGVVWYQRGQADSALVYLEEARMISERLGYFTLLNDIYNNLALVNAFLKRYEDAERYYRMDLEYCQSHGNHLKAAKTIVNLSKLLLEQGRKREALKTLDELPDGYRLSPEMRIEIYEVKNKCFAALGDFEEAYFWSTKQQKLSDSIALMMVSVQELNDKYLEEKAQREKAVENGKANEAKLAQVVAENQTQMILIIAGSIVLVISFLGFYFYIRWKQYRIRSLVAEAQVAKAKEEITIKLQEAELDAIRLSMLTQEKERKRIARNLHDRLGSKLSLVQISFQSILKHLVSIPEKTKQQYEETVIHLDEACEEVREISRNMMAGDLAHFGLQLALERFCQQVDVTCAIRVQFEAFGLPERLPAELEAQVYAMVRTLMENVLRHAEAKECLVQLFFDRELVKVVVKDDGRGFDPQTLSKVNGIGLRNVQERADALKGKFDIQAIPDDGVIVTVVLPLIANQKLR